MEGAQPGRVLRAGFEFNLKNRELYIDGCAVPLSEKPCRLLALLIEHPGELVTREEIQKQLWPHDTVVDFEHGINTAIKVLRRALGDSAESPKYIQTIPRRGYRLVVRVKPSKTPEAVEPTGVLPSVEIYASPEGERNAGRIGQKISHYRVLEVIGGGGMGMVFEAEDLRLGRRVALKFLPEEMASDPLALQRFEREARAASSLSHPNICTVHDILEHEEQPVIVMELLQGDTLRDRLAALSDGQKELPLEELLDIAIQTCDGLQAAHSKGIIHRDIKPANIFLTISGQVKILDFGLAKLIVGKPTELSSRPKAASFAAEVEVSAVIQPGSTADPSTASPPGLEEEAGKARWHFPRDDNLSVVDGLEDTAEAVPLQTSADATLTRSGSAIGTEGYMSPEQVRGEMIDPRTDLFSFGLVLYEMATGRRAFGGETAAVVRDAILHHSPVPLRELNPALPAKLVSTIDKALEKERERRWQSTTEIRAELEQIRNGKQPRVLHTWKWLAFSALLLIALATGAWRYWQVHRAARLTEKDTIVVGDFENKTGDSVFDDSLKQGLSVQLEQSPFLGLLSDSRVNETLKLMGRDPGDRLTPDLAREVCLRTGSKTMLTGSIAALGSQYVIGVKAVNCNSGDLLAEAQQQAGGKEQVLKALDAASVKLRAKLGTSVSSAGKYSMPLEEATTSSLEALKAYSLAVKWANARGNTAALPFFRRATEIDPNFAMPYVWMAEIYANLNQAGQAAENARQAYERRSRVSERERFLIEGTYHHYATGELEKAAQTYELWAQSYPSYEQPHVALGLLSVWLGNWQKAENEFREALRLEPNNGINYLNLAISYSATNRLEDAEAVYQEADKRHLENELLLQGRYFLAFLKNDSSRMVQWYSAAMGKPGAEDLLLATQADTEGWYGRLRSAHELTARALNSARKNQAPESAAAYQAAAALREVEAGLLPQARADALAALKQAPTRDVKAIAALALARAGDMAMAEKLATSLNQSFPLDTVVQKTWLPSVGAAVALLRKDPNRAVQTLQVAQSIELGAPTNISVYMCPVYLHGQAYLMLHDGRAAEKEFRKFIDHPGVAVNFPWGALARLGLARAYAIQAETDPAARDKARVMYQNFLILWKEADPELPIYRQARTEYAKLR